MIGMTFDEFYNKLYYGADIDMEYKNRYYHISSGCDMNNSNIMSISMYQYDKPQWEDEPTTCKEIFDISSNNVKYNIEKFINASLFDEKNFLEIMNEVRVVYS